MDQSQSRKSVKNLTALLVGHSGNCYLAKKDVPTPANLKMGAKKRKSLLQHVFMCPDCALVVPGAISLYDWLITTQVAAVDEEQRNELDKLD
ncbi:hypothetical protein ACROYT_G015682 [Oculina patagonica]